MGEYVNQEVFEEYAKRMEEEHRRQNRRIELLETANEHQTELMMSVQRLSMSIESMVKEQRAQGERLEKLEKVPAQSWNTLRNGILSAVAAAIGAGIVAVIVRFI